MLGFVNYTLFMNKNHFGWIMIIDRSMIFFSSLTTWLFLKWNKKIKIATLCRVGLGMENEGHSMT